MKQTDTTIINPSINENQISKTETAGIAITTTIKEEVIQTTTTLSQNDSSATGTILSTSSIKTETKESE